ncbi:uncharacterized protein LOC115598425 [Calypte anna]|uniref:uncharacterized protein LOC115598425 n=1 Tax=Calypte anna TaxID=9244 RepID=UPI0011C34947|nr:uncharacterized protein LOC115598425 [Calypte anna]
MQLQLQRSSEHLGTSQAYLYSHIDATAANGSSTQRDRRQTDSPSSLAHGCIPSTHATVKNWEHRRSYFKTRDVSPLEHVNSGHGSPELRRPANSFSRGERKNDAGPTATAAGGTAEAAEPEGRAGLRRRERPRGHLRPAAAASAHLERGRGGGGGSSRRLFAARAANPCGARSAKREGYEEGGRLERRPPAQPPPHGVRRGLYGDCSAGTAPARPPAGRGTAAHSAEETQGVTEEPAALPTGVNPLAATAAAIPAAAPAARPRARPSSAAAPRNRCPLGHLPPPSFRSGDWAAPGEPCR